MTLVSIGTSIIFCGFLFLVFALTVLGGALCRKLGASLPTKKLALNCMYAGYALAGLGLVVCGLSHLVSLI
jgi:hypothetical protein